MRFISKFILKLKRKYIMSYISSIVRHGLTFVGGLLVAKGFIDEETANSFVAVNSELVLGLVTYLVGQLLSFYDKKK